LSKIYKRIKIPTLFIYGESDDLVLPPEGIKFYKKIKSPKMIVIIKDLDHIFSGENVKIRVIRITLQWLKKYFN